MKKITRSLVLSATFAMLVPVAAGEPATQDEVAQALGQLRQYDEGQDLKPLRTVEMLVARSTGEPAARRRMAEGLAGILADAKTSPASREFICGQLPLVASDAQVPLLERMLGEPATAEMARRALAAIPGEASGAALRGALGRLRDGALVGAINSLGDRRDERAAGELAKLLASADGEVFAATARAMGKIGTVEAGEALAKAKAAPQTLAAIRDGQLRCAERLLAGGDRQAAEAIYRRVLAAGGPVRLRAAGLAGLAEACGERALPEVLAALDADEPILQVTALRLCRRSVPGATATAALAERLGALAPPARATLIDVLGERGDRAAAGAVAARLADPDESVRVAAVAAMGSLGDAASAAKLVALAAGEAGAVQQAARGSLARLRGQGVDEQIAALAGKGTPAAQTEAIRALAARGAAGAGPLLTRLAADEAEPVRLAALGALATFGGGECYAGLIEVMVGAAAPATAEAAEKAALAVGSRLGDQAARARPLLAAMPKAPAKARPTLIRLLGLCGGDDALAVVRAALNDEQQEVQDEAVRALAGWPDGAAMDDLLRVARTGRSLMHRVVALRGYLRLARSAGDDRLKRLQAVREIATTKQAKETLLATLANVPDAGALGLAVSYLDDPEVRTAAAMAALKVGESIAARDPKAVGAAMERLEAKLDDAGLVAKAKALRELAARPPRRGGAGSRPIQEDKKRSAARAKELAAQAPKGFSLVSYLDCGPDFTNGAKDGPSLRVLPAQQYAWAGSEGVGKPQFGTIHFAGQEVSFEATALKPARAYQLGLTWWDFDHDTRVESVWASAGRPARTVKLLGPTKLPSYVSGSKLPEQRTLAIPRALTATGTVRVTFRNEGVPNVVVSEVWLLEGEADLPPAEPLPAEAPPAATDAVPAPAKEPVPVRPGKKADARVLIVTGIDYPGHPWRQTAPVLAAGLDKDPRLAVEVVETPDFLRSPKLGDYDVIVLHFMNWQSPDPGPEARENLRKVVAGGKGLVLVHFACGAFQGWPEFAKIAGRAWDPKMRGHDPHGPFRVDIVDADHPVTKGLKPFETTDELYTCLAGDTPIQVLATATSKVDKKPYAMAFVLTYGKGRVFHSPLGHDVKAFGPAVLELFRRGTAWAAGLDK